ncbi:MAG: transglutaminase family protein, partial [Nocardioides sp.]|nr:transglutaminase family protein [Nocardioides sp.]
YRVTHRTTYTYDDDVTVSFGVGHLVPRSLPWQRVVSQQLRVSPDPGDTDHDQDCYGNAVSYFQVTAPHTVLEIEAVSEVEVSVPTYDEAGLGAAWETACPILAPRAPGAWRACDFALATPGVDHARGAREYAAPSLTPGRPIAEAVSDLMHRIHTDFDYDKTATTVTSTVADTLVQRAGVCQDFAHLALACLRSHGVAARYVSGYLATQPPPGRERVVGADASHAWLAVWVPPTAAALAAHPSAAGEWLAIDPTNDQWANDRYVTVAWGRGYGDVPPLRGIIFTEATTSALRVSVDVAPLDPPEVRAPR